MAQGALFIGWGTTVRGRERQALRVFGELLQYLGQQQQQGEVEHFEPVQLEPHGGDLNGFLLVRGDQEQLNRLRTSAEFQRLAQRSQLVVEAFGVVSAYVGQEQQRLYATFEQQLADFQ